MTYSRNAKRDLLGREFVLGNLGRLDVKEVKNGLYRGKSLFIGEETKRAINEFLSRKNL